jgi:TonB family protein
MVSDWEEANSDCGCTDEAKPEMLRLRAWASSAMSILCFGSLLGQTAIPYHLPELKYPPIARVAHVQGDVVISFRVTTSGSTTDVSAVSGPVMLQGIATDNVKAWYFKEPLPEGGQLRKATFHFALEPPADGYNEGQAVTKVEVSGDGDIRVFSVATTGLNRSECPSAAERVPAPAVIDGDFVELHRWNEVVRVSADGIVAWKEREQGAALRRGLIEPSDARALLERFRTPAVWGLCGNYDQAGLMDGGSSSFEVRIGGRGKRVGEYGDVAPPIFRDVEDAVDAAAKTHQWRHGNARRESIIEVSYEFLPKPGKTKLMDAILKRDKTGIQAALATEDKFTDADASGWTPLMYAAGSYSSSGEGELLKAGADVNARSKRGETALMAAAATGMADEDLIHAGADVNAINDIGMTVLMLLSQRGRPDEIATLLKAGADARRKDAVGRTALDYLNEANCGRPIVTKRDPPGMMEGVVTYSRCNALGDDYSKSKALLIAAGARATRVSTPNKPK